MTDSISRCELFNKLATIPAPPEANNFKAEVYKVIQQMETIDKWIPTSERLPKIGEVVLVTWEWRCKQYITIAYMVTIRGVTYWDSKLQHEFEPLNVVAWMPLPKPYKERSK